MAKNSDWTRDELILAINLYCKTPFKKITIRNPEIIDLANLLDRTPSAVFKKLINFVYLDTALQASTILHDRGKSGPMSHNRQDKEIWDEFSGNPSKLEYESEKILIQYLKKPSDNWKTFIFNSDLSTKTSNVLIHNFSSFEELLACDESDLLGLPNCDSIIAREILWFIFIIKSNFSARASNVLTRNFSSLEELFEYDAAKLSQLPNSDLVIQREIIAFIQSLKNPGAIALRDDEIPDQLFYAEIPNGITSKDAFPMRVKETETTAIKKKSPKWNTFIVNSNLSPKTSRVLIRNFSSLEELLFFDEASLLQLPKCNSIIAREIKAFLKKIKHSDLMDGFNGAELPDSLDAETKILPANENKPAVEKMANPEFEILIIKSNLSVRATNILLHNFSSLEELISCDRDQLFKLKNTGRKTVKEILDFIKHLCGASLIEPIYSAEDAIKSCPSTLKRVLAMPPDYTTFNKLPIFNRIPLESVSVSDLHPDFKPFVPLSDIAFSARTTTIIRRMGLNTIGEMICTPYGELMKQKNFGRKCLNEIQQTIKQIVFENIEDSAPYPQHEELHQKDIVGYSSYEAMVDRFIKNAIEIGRIQEVIFDRLCFQSSKIPTLDELGKKHELTRERVRQIIFKATKILKIKSNFKKLVYLWDTVEKIIRTGGGVIHLGALAVALKDEFDWPQIPNPLALGQLLSLWLPDRKLKETSAIIEIDCECLSCERPLKAIQSFDFDSNESFHLKVVERKLLDDCQKNCEHMSGPVLAFHRAFIEKMVSASASRFIINNGLLYLYETWAVKFGKNLEDAITVVLKKHGQPMHYSNIAMELRKASAIFEEMRDHNVHASLSRYQSVELIDRGTFALKEWELKRYQSVSDAIEQLLRSSYYPMQRQDIIAKLKEEFSEANISASLYERTTRFIAIGDGFYDCMDRWQKRTCQDFMKDLPEDLHQFMTYLVTNNNCSYKLMLALVFIRGMNDDGEMPISTLSDRFYNFFAARHGKGVVVEKDEVSASKINILSPSEFKNLTLKNPIISFLTSGFFIKTGAVLKLKSGLIQFLNKCQFKDIVSIILLKSISEYFSAIELPLETEHHIRIGGAKASNAANDISASGREFSQEYNNENMADIAIKKIKRVKIQL